MDNKQEIRGNFSYNDYLRTTSVREEKVTSIGRDLASDIYFPAPTVSRHHAIIRRQNDEIWLIDKNSTNGTFVNSVRIVNPCKLASGDIIQIGPYTLIHKDGNLIQYEISSGIKLDVNSLTLSLGKGKKKNVILKDIDLAINPGEFVAFVGPSGAGKSTLMNSISGLIKTENCIYLNGDELENNISLYRSLIGYVPQDDIIHKELTVNSALRYAAQLRLPPDTSRQEINSKISEVLSNVSLQDEKAKLISELSGGERKRVSIAVELLAEPRLFFLDEPTSGLDPGLEKTMMVTLKELASNGKTVILVTHATTNIKLCDMICFISKGKLVYWGPPEEVSNFFNTSANDFAEIYQKLLGDQEQSAYEKANQWAKEYKESYLFQKYITERSINYKLNPFHKIKQNNKYNNPPIRSVNSNSNAKVNSLYQFIVLSKRYFELLRNDKIMLSLLIAIMPLIGFLLLGISKSNWLIGDTQLEINRQLTEKLANGHQTAFYSIVANSQTFLFMSALASVLFGLFTSSYEIVKERSIYKRERLATLQLFPYLLSKFVVLSCFAILQCILFVLIIKTKINFPDSGIITSVILEFFITLTLGACASILVGLLISAIAKNTNVVIYMILGLLFFQIIFAGVIFELPGSNGQLLSGLTLTRWTVEAMGSSVNIAKLDEKSTIRYQPSTVTKDVELDVDKPDPNNPTNIIKETITKQVSIDMDPVDITNKHEFHISYESTYSHLFTDWVILILYGFVFGIETLMILRNKDIY